MARGLHWFRSDLRLRDNTALDPLARRAEQWLPVFVIDPRLATPRALDYPRPIGDHAERRKLALERYRAARARAAT